MCRVVGGYSSGSDWAMPRKTLRRMKPDEEMNPGKYVLYRQHHFVGFEVWNDWTCILRPTCRTHIGHVQSWDSSLLENYEIVFKLENRAEGSWESQEDAQGGAPFNQGMMLFQSPLSGRCLASSLALNFQEDKRFTAGVKQFSFPLQCREDAQGGAPCAERIVSFQSLLSGRSRASCSMDTFQEDAAFVAVARDVCSKAFSHPPLAMTFLLDAWTVPEKLTWSQLGEPLGVDVVLHSVSNAWNRKLLHAIKENDAEKVRVFLMKGQDPNTKYPNGFTPLSYSAWAGAVDALSMLVEGGGSLNLFGLDGKLPLHHAVGTNNFTAVRTLLHQKAEPNLKDSEGNTPVLIAAMQDGARSVQILEALAEAGAELDMADCSGYTPFGCCSNPQVLVYLMDSVWPRLSWQRVMERNYCEIFQYCSSAEASGVCKIMSKQLGAGGGAQCPEAVDVLGGSLMDVWGPLWQRELWGLLPLAEFCQMRGLNSSYHRTMYTLKDAWHAIKQILEAGPIAQLVTDGVRLRGFHQVVRPEVEWDLYGCRQLERQYMRGTWPLALPHAIAEGWKSRNPDHGEACELLAKHAVKCRQALDIDGDGIGVFAVRKLVVQVQLGPARAYLAFLEVRDVEDLTTEESEQEEEGDDVQGGFYSQDDSPPSDSDSDDICGGASFHGWLQSIAADSGVSSYTPCGGTGEGVMPMTEHALCASEAAEWFMQVVMPFWTFSHLQNCIPSFPYDIQTCIQRLVVWCSSCPVEDKPLWYMWWCLSVAGMPGQLCIQVAEPHILLWKYTWPKSSLKEAMNDLGAETSTTYQHVQTVAEWNSRAWDSEIVLAPWLPRPHVTPGAYIMKLGGVTTAVWVTSQMAVWSCGRLWAEVSLTKLHVFVQAHPNVELYRLVPTASQTEQQHCGGEDPRVDVCGNATSDALGGSKLPEQGEHTAPRSGDRVMILQEPWLKKILAGEKTMELRSRRARHGLVWLAKGNTIYGKAEIANCGVLTRERFLELQQMHCVSGTELPYQKTLTYGLELRQVQPLQLPVTFCRLRGSIGWAKVRYSVNEHLPRCKPVRTGRHRPVQRRTLKEQQQDRGQEVPKRDQESWRVSWPSAADACLFKQSGMFAPTSKTLQADGDVALPESLVPAVGMVFTSANTLGDGACGIHALFGVTNTHAQLECQDARRLAADALEAALCHEVGESLRAEAVKLSLWDELAVPGTAQECGVEAKLFWKHFNRLRPSDAADVLKTVEANASFNTNNERWQQTLREQCRNFFLHAPKAAIADVCEGIGYSENEGCEDCFYERQGQKYVKGTAGSVWPANGPKKKLDAVQQPDAAFDALRTSVFLARDVAVCVYFLQEAAAKHDWTQSSALAQILEGRPNDRLRLPDSFHQAAVEAYLAAVLEESYFFSYDEIALIAEMREQSVVIVRDAGPTAFVPCCVATCPSTDPIVILLKNADGPARVRSHFERLAPQAAVGSACQACARREHDASGLQNGGHIDTKEIEACQKNNDTECPRDIQCRDGSNEPPNEECLDGDEELETAAVKLLHTYEAGGNTQDMLANLQLFSVETTRATWLTMRGRLKAAVTEYVKSSITAADAVYLANPFWRTCFFPIAVLFEAWSRTTGLPTIFYIDAFYTLMASLLKKDITYRVANFSCRARYWAVGTAAPGPGKSPALDPLKQALLEVLRESQDLVPGKNADGFHMQPVGTHLAAVDRLRQTGGYQFFGASEGGPILCPSWPTSSTWNQGTHVNWQRYLDAATGQWERQT